MIAMPENNITQTPESQLTPPLQQRGIGEVILLASFIIGIITGLLAIGLVDVLGFVVGCINFVFALPFTLVAALVYRKTQLSPRFELLTLILAGGACVIVGGLILLNFLLSRVVLD
jgi:hypothetical protein